MGVVKNLMVRFGADVSGMVSGMKKAGSATSQATDSIKRATSGMRKSVKESFTNSRMSVREYSAYVAKTRQDHTVATQSAQRLSDQIRQMERVYRRVKTATEGLDLSKPLKEQITDTENSLQNMRSRLKEVIREQKNAAQQYSFWNQKALSLEAGLHDLKDAKSGRPSKNTKGIMDRLESANKQTELLRSKANSARKEWISIKEEIQKAEGVLKRLNLASIQLYERDFDVASDTGMKTLAADIQRVKNELNATQLQAAKTGEQLHSMGVAPTLKYTLKNIGTTAAQAAGGGVKRLGSVLKSLGSTALRGIVSLPVKLLGIGKSAASGTGGLNKMVRSIRNIGIVSLGMRVASGMFGRLRSIISSYISENEALNASVTSIKNQLGQALAPAINMVITVMQRLMPVVTAVSNAINSVFTTLFGNVQATTAAIGDSASELETYGFDQITKVSDNSGSSSSGSSASSQLGEQSALVQRLTGWIEQLKAAFTAGDWAELGGIVGGGINSALDSINTVDIGAKAGAFANNVFTTLRSALSSTDFSGIGAKVGQLVNSGFEAFDWTKAGETVGMALTAIPSMIVGFIKETDWGLVAHSVSNALTSAILSVSEWLRSTDWTSIGEAVGSCVSGIEWIEVFSSLGSLMWEGVKASLETLAGFIKGLGPRIIVAAISAVIAAVAAKIAITPLITAFGIMLKTVVAGIISSIAGWPALLIAAAAAAIAAFSLWMKNGGSDVVAGFLRGIKESFSNIGTWLNENIFTPFTEAFKSLFGIHSPSTVMQEQGGFLIDGLFKGIEDNWKSITSFFGTALSDLKSSLSNGWDKIKEGASSAWTKVKDTITGNSSSAKSSVQTDWNSMESAAASANGRISSGVSSKWTAIKKSITDSLSSARDTSSRDWSKMQDSATTTGGSIKDIVYQNWMLAKGYITDNIASARASASDSWTGISTDAEKASSSMASKTKSGFQNMKDGIVNTFSEVWSGVKGWINKLIGGVEDMVNFIIDGINGMIGAFNSISSVGKKFGLNLSIRKITAVSLPRLADGGIASGPTAALIGEAGKEAVLPLERNTGWMSQLAQKIVELGGGTSGASVTIPIYLGGRKVTQYVIKDINQIIKTTGVCPINV